MSKPTRTACQTDLDLGHKQAMKVDQVVLSPEAALIAEKIPRIEPMLRMIEANGFVVVGLNEEPEIEDPIFKEPIQLKGTSQGINAWSTLLRKRGYHVVRGAEPLEAQKAVQE